MEAIPTAPLIILTAPSGAGKTSITRFLLGQFPQLAFSISATTRPPRPGEVDGRDYYFVKEAEFLEDIRQDRFAEWEMVYEGKYYGTRKSELERIWKQGQVPVLDIDVKGAIHLQKLYAQSLSIFVEPPSSKALRDRLLARGTETAESLQTRLSKADFELSFRDHFDRILVNDQLDKACQEAAGIINKFLKDK